MVQGAHRIDAQPDVERARLRIDVEGPLGDRGLTDRGAVEGDDRGKTTLAAGGTVVGGVLVACIAIADQYLQLRIARTTRMVVQVHHCCEVDGAGQTG